MRNGLTFWTRRGKYHSHLSRSLSKGRKLPANNFAMTTTKDFNQSAAGEVVMVTGGAGFLGQHIIGHLQEKASHVSEIRVLDIRPYSNKLGHRESKPLTSTLGDICDQQTVQQACQGVTTVIHVAGLVSYGTFPDINGMQRINVQGTRNIVESCLNTGVERLIFCSTVDVVVGFDDIREGMETTTCVPKQFLFPGYPATKYEAECLVLNANGQKSVNGNPLWTMSLRANVMYGEEDPFYVTSGLRSAASNRGRLVQVGNGQSKFQQVYVGNTAWAFVCADRALRLNYNLGGEIFYIPDYTPVQNSFLFMQPYLESRNYGLSQYRLPCGLVYYSLYLMELVLHLLAPLIRINLPTASCSVRYINMDLYFNGSKGRRLLGYQPLYSPQEAEKRSLEYYKHVKL
ncbi:3 beta-hydroxysteroid dehydrogenase/Delta 5--_4-isomerase type 1-like [Mizuhopecten yessoensis]|uniref:3-beta-hydroxysteroid dehydrogenase 1 n=1 Tax=Mizuhopecten yessoensis TaxID=6573 RepID=A0A385J6X0_MIZYE|nr:3 beta-hydroxysteroid dehydrogenase/Delta 5-->4-isomerase type 1-like [Mizuhopecten yessoensis]AXY92162.1 3-beta-hydroxysteroid dehydrogenase 1 [Mizuhopecten yessoensis]